MALQFRMRWCSPFSSKVVDVSTVWRGPAGNTQVTLSVVPIGWQATQPTHAPVDQRPSPVLKKRWPLSTLNSSLGSPASSTGNGSDSMTGVTVVCVDRSMWEMERPTSL